VYVLKNTGLAAGAVSGKSDWLRFSRALDRSNSRTIIYVLTCRNIYQQTMNIQQDSDLG